MILFVILSPLPSSEPHSPKSTWFWEVAVGRFRSFMVENGGVQTSCFGKFLSSQIK